MLIHSFIHAHACTYSEMRCGGKIPGMTLLQVLLYLQHNERGHHTNSHFEQLCSTHQCCYHWQHVWKLTIHWKTITLHNMAINDYWFSLTLHVSAVFGQHQGDGIEYHAEITKVLD